MHMGGGGGDLFSDYSLKVLIKVRPTFPTHPSICWGLQFTKYTVANMSYGNSTGTG